MDFLSSNSMLMMEKSMGFLWTKQAAILDNISNAETADYKPKVVNFEDTLTSKLEQAGRNTKPRQSIRGVLENTPFGVTEMQQSTRLDDNGVNITDEMVEMVRNAYQQQYVLQSINSNLSILRTAINGN
jgi:flagellar basal-body rod protein FlgB